MELGPYPGSFECRILENVNVQKAGDEGANDNQQVEESTTGHRNTYAGRASRKTSNENVTVNRRDQAAIRNEIVQCSLNFLQERMSVAQDKTITAMIGIIGASLPPDVINTGRQLEEDLFSDEIAPLAHSVCDVSNAIFNLSTLPANSDVRSTLATKLRQMIPVCCGTFQKVLISMYCLAPHSMQTEQVMSYYNTICSDKRLSTDSSTANYRLQIALNGKE